MKDKKTEEVKVEVVDNKKIEKKEKIEKIDTKGRVISLVVGIFIGAIITSGVFCICMRPCVPKRDNNQMIRMHERNRSYMPGKNIRPKYKAPSNDNSSETQTTEENTEKTEQSNN